MVLPEGALQSGVWQLVPKEALHFAAGAGAEVDLGAVYRGCWGRGGAQACRHNSTHLGRSCSPTAPRCLMNVRMYK